MTLNEIKEAVNSGKSVHWKSDNYVVIKDSIGQWLVHSQGNDCYAGLTWRDGVTMNENESDFYVK
jgi:hypothetical protein|tara:strand:+ start:1087 stop:1281 length:195 start_codon:yes stop_codon:yes gene_type:complete